VITPACMGGWCALRDDCPRYHAQSGEEPSERLCEPGRDGVSATYPVRIQRRVGSWERTSVPSLLRPATPFDSLVSA
jgi:hypothetical protein